MLCKIKIETECDVFNRDVDVWGDDAPLTELCPYDSSFFNSPRLCGRGGGIAHSLQTLFKCHQTFDDPSYSSFEAQLFTVTKTFTVLIAAI